jgi:7-cyano-7-deazaguanine synthase in queuosine biosynthesis
MREAMVKPKAVVLLSRGLDSTTVLAKSREQDFDSYALTLRYGQRHEAEIDAARRIATRQSLAQHFVVDICPWSRCFSLPWQSQKWQGGRLADGSTTIGDSWELVRTFV